MWHSRQNRGQLTIQCDDGQRGRMARCRMSFQSFSVGPRWMGVRWIRRASETDDPWSKTLSFVEEPSKSARFSFVKRTVARRRR